MSTLGPTVRRTRSVLCREGSQAEHRLLLLLVSAHLCLQCAEQIMPRLLEHLDDGPEVGSIRFTVEEDLGNEPRSFVDELR